METEKCPYCQQPIPADEWDRHEKGRDPKRLECGHQDLAAVKADAEPVSWTATGLLPDLW